MPRPPRGERVPDMPISSPRTALTAAVACLALGAGAGADLAAADSISYLKDGDVWLTTPDGSRQFQVTTTGGYSYASQADDGTFIALAGERLHRLDRFGKILAEIGRASCRGRGEISVGAASFKKKK